MDSLASSMSSSSEDLEESEDQAEELDQAEESDRERVSEESEGEDTDEESILGSGLSSKSIGSQFQAIFENETVRHKLERTKKSRHSRHQRRWPFGKK